MWRGTRRHTFEIGAGRLRAASAGHRAECANAVRRSEPMQRRDTIRRRKI